MYSIICSTLEIKQSVEDNRHTAYRYIKSTINLVVLSIMHGIRVYKYHMATEFIMSTKGSFPIKFSRGSSTTYYFIHFAVNQLFQGSVKIKYFTFASKLMRN